MSIEMLDEIIANLKNRMETHETDKKVLWGSILTTIRDASIPTPDAEHIISQRLLQIQQIDARISEAYSILTWAEARRNQLMPF